MSRSIPIDDDGYNMGYQPAEVPYGLEQAIHNLLKDFHTGRHNAISRDQLLIDLRVMGFHWESKSTAERMMRDCINQMRHNGELICSTGGVMGGYWMATSNEEVHKFTNHECKSRAMDLLEQAQAMEAAAERLFGRYSPEKQISLF